MDWAIPLGLMTFQAAQFAVLAGIFMRLGSLQQRLEFHARRIEYLEANDGRRPDKRRAIIR